MRLTIILMTAFVLHAGARSLSQQVTISVKNVPSEKVIGELQKQTGYIFLYTDSTLTGINTVTIKAVNEGLNEFLGKLFSPLGLAYAIESKTIHLSAKSGPGTSKRISTDPLLSPLQLIRDG